MPQETIYQPQVAPGSTAGIPLASPQDFGAGVGQGIAELGGALHRRDLDAYKIERQLRADQEQNDVTAKFAQLRLQNDKTIDDMRTVGLRPGAAGHADDTQKLLENQLDGLTAGISENSVRNALTRQFGEYAAETTGREYQFELGKRIAKTVSDHGIANDAMRNRIATSTDPATPAQEIKFRIEAIQASAAPADVKESLIRDVNAQADLGQIDNLVNNGGARAALALIDHGEFNEHLTPEQVASARSHAEVEMRRADAVAEHQVALQKAATNEAIATAKAQQSAGIVVPDATLAQLQQAAATGGDTSNATELAAIRVANGVNRETQGWTAQQYDGEIARLRSLGTKATQDQQVRLHALETIAPGRKAEFERDPGQWAALNGTPPPALNFADPATWAARRQWAAAVSKAAGRPVPLLQPAEVNQLQANFHEGDKGRLQVIDTIAPLGGRDALQAMRQIAPDDAVAQRLVGLPAPNRASAARGADARKADRSLIDDMKPDGAGADALEKYQRDVAPALARFAPQDANAAREIAGNLYADWARSHGVQTFNPDQYGTFLQVAAGATIDRSGTFHGGIGYWNNAPVKLPAEQSQAQFERVLTNLAWNPDKRVPHPVYSDGKTVIPPAVLRSYVPVARSDGYYEFHGPNGVVVADNRGKAFALDLGAIGRAHLK